jgi:hypothetical protein
LEVVFFLTENVTVTWVSPDKDTENQIDHLTISRQWRSSLCDVRNRRGTDVGSDKFCYLGSMVSQDGDANEDVTNRINKARGAFAQLRPVWRSHRIHKRTKLRIFKSNVMSALLYGCET